MPWGPRRLRSLADGDLPTDLSVTIAVAVLTGVVVLIPVLGGTLVRLAVVTGFVVFFPGYAVVSALFPERYRSSSEVTVAPDGSERRTVTDRGVTNFERVAYAVALSVIGVPFLGPVLGVTPFEIRLVPLVLTLTTATVLVSLLSARRRAALPPPNRYEPPAFRPSAGSSRADVMATAFVVLSVALLVGSAGYVATDPGDEYTEFYVLSENQNGELVAGDYPTDLTMGQPNRLVLGVGNRGGRSMEYTVVAQLQRISGEDDERTVVERETLDRIRITASANETVRREHSFTPGMSGDRLRLVYLLYEGDVPAEPTIETADQRVHLWVDVDDASASLTRPNLSGSDRLAPERKQSKAG